MRRHGIHVMVGPRIVEVCDEVSVRRYLDAPNVRIVRKRKTGQVMEVHLQEFGDDSKLRSHGSGQKLTYEESLNDGNNRLTTLKRFDSETGGYRRWSDQDGFDSLRFNPALLKPLFPNEQAARKAPELLPVVA